MVTIESKPAEAPLRRSRSLRYRRLPGQGLQVTDRAVKRIRVAMAKEGVSPDRGRTAPGRHGRRLLRAFLLHQVRHPAPRARPHLRFDGVRVFVDPKSFLYLHGMTLDYEETLMRQGFNFINPNSTRSCGCGSSFSS